MKTLKPGLLIPVIALATAFSGIISQPTKAASIQPEDFTNPIIQDYENLGLPELNPVPVVIDGDIYTVGGIPDDPNLIYLTDSRCIDNNCLANRIGNGFMDIELKQPVIRAGAFVCQGGCFPSTDNWSVEASFFNKDNSLLGSVTVTRTDITQDRLLFAGFETDTNLISRIRFTDIDQPFLTMTIDNLTVESVPEPTSTFSFLALSTLGAVLTLKRKLNHF